MTRKLFFVDELKSNSLNPNICFNINSSLNQNLYVKSHKTHTQRHTWVHWSNERFCIENGWKATRPSIPTQPKKMDDNCFTFALGRYAISSTKTLHLDLHSSSLKHMLHSLVKLPTMIGTCRSITSSSHHFLWLPWECLIKTLLHAFVSRYSHILTHLFLFFFFLMERWFLIVL